jgi:NADPH:quinone reductase
MRRGPRRGEHRGVAHTLALDQPDPASAIRAHAPDGVDRIIEVAFSDNVDLDAAVAKNQAVVAAHATRQDRPDFPLPLEQAAEAHDRVDAGGHARTLLAIPD